MRKPGEQKYRRRLGREVVHLSWKIFPKAVGVGSFEGCKRRSESTRLTSFWETLFWEQRSRIRLRKRVDEGFGWVYVLIWKKRLGIIGLTVTANGKLSRKQLDRKIGPIMSIPGDLGSKQDGMGGGGIGPWYSRI